MIKIVVSSCGRVAKVAAEECNLSYSLVRKLLREKDIKLNGKRIKEDLTCEKGDLLEIYYTPPTLEPEFCDQNVAIFFKPVGISSEDFFKRVKESFPTALAVHRLDTNTRGIMVYALNAEAEKELTDGFKNRTFTKKYVAEIKGVPKQKAACISAYLKKNAEAGTVFISDKPLKGYLPIKTAYRVESTSDISSVVEVELITGRTHQIRAHLAFIGHPIIGDGKYGDGAFNKKLGAKVQRLQAVSIRFAFKENSPLYYLDGREFFVKREIGKVTE